MGLNHAFEFYSFLDNLLLRSATNSELALQVSNFEGGFRIVFEFLQLSGVRNVDLSVAASMTAFSQPPWLRLIKSAVTIY